MYAIIILHRLSSCVMIIAAVLLPRFAHRSDDAVAVVLAIAVVILVKKAAANKKAHKITTIPANLQKITFSKNIDVANCADGIEMAKN